MTRVLFSMLTVFCVCGLMAAQVELTYTYADKHEEKKTVSATPDAKGVVTVIVKRSQLPQGVEWVSVLPEFAAA